MVIKSRKRQSKHDREGKKMSRKLSWKTRRKENSANGVDMRTALKQTMGNKNGKMWVCIVWFGAHTSGELWPTK